MRHVDAFCHFFPHSLFEKMSQTAGGTNDIGKRMQGVPLMDWERAGAVQTVGAMASLRPEPCMAAPLPVFAGSAKLPSQQAITGERRCCRTFDRRRRLRQRACRSIFRKMPAPDLIRGGPRFSVRKYDHARKRLPRVAMRGRRCDSPHRACRSGETSSMISIAGVELDVFERGHGAPILYLHGGGGHRPRPSVSRAAGERAPRDRAVASRLRQVVAAGLARQRRRHRPHLSRADGPARAWRAPTSSASRSAAGSPPRSPPRCRSGSTRLVLIGPVGVKTGSPDKLDIPDVFAMPREQLDRLRFHDPRQEPGRPRDACRTRSFTSSPATARRWRC